MTHTWLSLITRILDFLAFLFYFIFIFCCIPPDDYLAWWLPIASFRHYFEETFIRKHFLSCQVPPQPLLPRAFRVREGQENNVSSVLFCLPLNSDLVSCTTGKVWNSRKRVIGEKVMLVGKACRCTSMCVTEHWTLHWGVMPLPLRHRLHEWRPFDFIHLLQGKCSSV